MAVKPTKPSDYKEVTYTTERWQLLKALRSQAEKIMATLEEFHLCSTVHGSIARGDVNKTSDIDVFISETQNSFLVEIAVEKGQIPINARYIIQATPNYAMKAHIEIDERTTVSFPLMQMRRVEREFYRFGGEVDFEQLKMDIRVAGVDKRLMLIEPTEKGHVESSIIGREESAAKTLGISAETVLDRVHTLIKRDSVGRTGVFVKRELGPDETFELALKKLSEVNPAVRRRMKK
jgi:predicted nucleotidyltransferase